MFLDGHDSSPSQWRRRRRRFKHAFCASTPVTPQFGGLLLLLLIVVVLLELFVVYADAIDPTIEETDMTGIGICNSNFYAKQLCIDHGKQYRCKCNPGFVWNGQVCISTALNSYFEFEDKSTSGFVFFDKTFPKLNAFTISTWLQIYSRQGVNSTHPLGIGSLSPSFSPHQRLTLYNDTRTVFTYSYDNHVNALRCQLSSSLSKHEHSRINSYIYFTISVLNSFCIFSTPHTYSNNVKNQNSSLWFHMAITWNSKSGLMQVYINGQLKHTCNRIAQGKELSRAGEFVLGQSHQPEAYMRRRTKQKVELDPKARQILFDLYSSDHSSSSTSGDQQLQHHHHHHQHEDENMSPFAAAVAAGLYPDENSMFDENTAFVGRLFNFNVWDRVHSRVTEFIGNIVNDCRLVYCGNAAQWSEYRPGTRGNLKIKWPTYLLWSTGSCLDEKYQRETCNRVCSREMGPECRQHVEKNFRWPKSKLNQTVRLKCPGYETQAGNNQNPLSTATSVLSESIANVSIVPPRMASRFCGPWSVASQLETNGVNGGNGGLNKIRRHRRESSSASEYSMIAEAMWHASNTNECVQPKLTELKREIYLFTSTDNFDETYIIYYLDRLLDATLNLIKLSSPSSSSSSSSSSTSFFSSPPLSQSFSPSKSSTGNVQQPQQHSPTSSSSSSSSNPASTLTSSGSAGSGGGGASSSAATSTTTNSFRSIHDVSTIIDAMTYLINAQRQILKRNIDSKLNTEYPSLEDTTKFTHNILAIINVILSLTKDAHLWSQSVPIGSESMRILKIVKHLSLTIYDFQRLNVMIPRGSIGGGLGGSSYDYGSNHLDLNKIHTSPNDILINEPTLNITSQPFASIEAKFENIVFSQRLIYYDYQMPMTFKFPDSSSREVKPASTSTVKPTKAPGGGGKGSKEVSGSSSKSNNKNRKTTTKQPPQTPPASKSSYNSGSFSSSSLSRASLDSLPSNFLGQIHFNEHNVSLPLFKTMTNNKTTPTAYFSPSPSLPSYQSIDPLSLLTVYYSNLNLLLPNHNKTFREKDNNLNSIVMTVDMIGIDGYVSLNHNTYNATFNKPITLKYSYLEFFNISDTRCVNLEDANDDVKNFRWSRKECQLKKRTPLSATCECFTLGTFSITSDLYDPNWSPAIEENIPLILPSYFGCVVVSLFGLATFSCLTYLKTRTTTTSVHKNLCISICLSQVILMVSLTRFNYEKIVCQAFALLNHYMVFVVFAWLLNEAFNLYITITYSAHQSTPMNDTGSQLRFYLLGWLLPAFTVLVYLFWYRGNYYDQKLCFFNLKNLSTNLIPMFALLVLTIMVMIISAKEHTEISYTKNAKANKMIANYTKAVWTQIALLALTWAFTFMSLIFFDSIVKYLFALLNCLQGSFLFVFYFLLNEEVRRYLRERKKRKKLRQRERNMMLANNIKAMVPTTVDGVHPGDPIGGGSGSGAGSGGAGGSGDGTTGADGSGGSGSAAAGSGSMNRKSEKYFREKFDFDSTKYTGDYDDDDDDDDSDDDSDDDDEDEEDDDGAAAGVGSGGVGGGANGDESGDLSGPHAANHTQPNIEFEIDDTTKSVASKKTSSRLLGASMSSTISSKSVKFGGQASGLSIINGRKLSSFNHTFNDWSPVMGGSGGPDASPKLAFHSLHSSHHPQQQHQQQQQHHSILSSSMSFRQPSKQSSTASSSSPTKTITSSASVYHHHHLPQPQPQQQPQQQQQQHSPVKSASVRSPAMVGTKVVLGGENKSPFWPLASTSAAIGQSSSLLPPPLSSAFSSQQMPPPATVAIPSARRQQQQQLSAAAAHMSIQISPKDIPDYNEEKVTVL